jgi:transglutaminase-like putative cysteine protease/predicted glutamine amidotransferase
VSRLLALSYDAPASPVVVLKATRADRPPAHTFGWGMAWYPPGDKSAVVVKDPSAVGDNPMTRVLRDWERFRSAQFIAHLRGAAQRVSQEDTQPFARSFAGCDWVIAHNGQLEHGFQTELDLGQAPAYEPVGHTDTEHVLCWLFTQLRDGNHRRLADIPASQLLEWLKRVNRLGSLNLLLSDGDTLCVHQDRGGFNRLHWTRLVPPHPRAVLENEEIELTLGGPLDENRTIVLIATSPLDDVPWEPLGDGEMLLFRRGELCRRVGSPGARTPVPGPAPASVPGTSAEAFYDVLHVTRYQYTESVERSWHVHRLRPVDDRLQRVDAFTLGLSPDGPWEDFEDVFGNQAVRVGIDQPYQELVVEARSRVRVVASDLGSPHARTRRTKIPLDWMPWERQMMSPYLMPLELATSELQELFDYAKSFVERQDFDLLATIEDLNRHIHRDYRYVRGSTTLETTPFDVYLSRQGVCQDFANLFICLARLLGLPARYRIGYLHTGADYLNKLQSEASHAWAEVYLPWVGWRGFDPTNGCPAGIDHLRVATGRNYRDATPTSGTIQQGGGFETLEVKVEVKRIEPT